MFVESRNQKSRKLVRNTHLGRNNEANMFSCDQKLKTKSTHDYSISLSQYGFMSNFIIDSKVFIFFLFFIIDIF